MRRTEGATTELARRPPALEDTDGRSRYRPDIDGLRALAIAAVVGYHLMPQTVARGFLGVDVFFVISGFLITGILWREVGEHGRISLVGFYTRRLRRIAPALLAVLVSTTAVAMVLLLPIDLVGFGKSVIAALLFVSNIYFWRDGDYFSRAAQEKPLLHTWSLGVEEQFYLLFPLVLVAAVRLGRRPAIAMVAVGTMASFVAAMIARRIGGELPAFYLLPTRAWELGVGALIAFQPYHAGQSAAVRRWRNELLGAAGLGLVIFALGASENSLPPSLPVALPAVAGAGLLLWSCAGLPTLVGRGLGLAPPVFLGRISYSLYLWHWPVIVFAQYWLVRPLVPIEIAAAVATMFALAIASWRWVERPFRQSTFPFRTLLASSIAGSVALIAAAIGIVASGGLPARLSSAASRINAAAGTNYRCAIGDYLPFGASRACALVGGSHDPTKTDVVLLGNSHAQMYAPLVGSIVAGYGARGLLVPANGCLPTPDVNSSVDCLRIAEQKLTAVIGLEQARIVVIAFRWQAAFEPLVDGTGTGVDHGLSAVIAGLDRVTGRLRAAGKTVIIVGPIATPGWDVASVLGRSLAFGRAVGRPLSGPKETFYRDYAPVFTHYLAMGDVGFIRPDRVECAGSRCDYLIAGESLFADDNHLAEGSLDRFLQAFKPPLAAALATSAKAQRDHRAARAPDH